MTQRLDIFEEYVLIPLIKEAASEIAKNSKDKSKWKEIIARHFKQFPDIARQENVRQAIAEQARRILNGKAPRN